MKNLTQKIDRAIRLLQSIPQDKPIEVCYSGGKDSDVILELAKMAGIPHRAIYKNTTIDPPGTIAHCKSKGVEIYAPKIRFFDLVRQKGIPTRFSRFCCEHLKEYKVLDRSIQGIRQCESYKRRQRYKEPEYCRTYRRGEKVKVYLPILTWSDKEVEEFIIERGIQCHPLYYDEHGKFHVERRLGCIGCLMQADNGISDFQRCPKMLKQWIRNLQIYLDTHPNVASRKKFGDAYNIMFYALFCKSYDEYKTLTTGMFPEERICPEKFLKEFFNI